MCPQLFINYKLQSVAHLPWRQMTYKFLNTIIDDLFAFVVKMPLLHRLSVFRDGKFWLQYSHFLQFKISQTVAKRICYRSVESLPCIDKKKNQSCYSNYLLWQDLIPFDPCHQIIEDVTLGIQCVFGRPFQTAFLLKIGFPIHGQRLAK